MTPEDSARLESIRAKLYDHVSANPSGPDADRARAMLAKMPKSSPTTGGQQPAVAPDDVTAADLESQQPGVVDRFKETAKGIGRTVAGGARAAVEGVAHPIETIKNPVRRRQFERGLDDMLTLGHGQKFAARIGNALGDAPSEAIGPETFGSGVTSSGGAPVPNTQASDQAAEPDFRSLGNVVGLVRNPFGKAASASSKAIATGLGFGGRITNPILAAGAGAARNVAAYEATVPAISALSANAEGDRLGTALRTATDPFGLLVAGASGALGGAVKAGGQERVLKRTLSNIGRGEEGGKTKLGVGKKLTAKAGAGGGDLGEVLSRHPDIEQELATRAASAPGPTAAKVGQRMDQISQRLEPIYEQLDAAGGAPVIDVVSALDDLHGGFKSSGNIGMAEVVDRFRNTLLKNYGAPNGDVIDGTSIPASSLRNLRNEIGQVAFAGDPNVNAAFRARATQAIYGAINGAIEKVAAKTPTVNLDELRTLNKDMSMFVTIKDALADRASKGAMGGTSFGHALVGPALAGGGFAAGGLMGAAAGLATKAAATAALPKLRALDYALSKGNELPTGAALQLTRERDPVALPEAVRRALEARRRMEQRQ